MIATLTGLLARSDGDSVLIQTDGGVGYAVTVPLGVFERLPPVGQRVSLFTELVVREDGWALYGFDRPGERGVFQRLLGASGFGPKLAIALLSLLGAERTVHSIRTRDIAALSTVSGIGRKKAERLVLELQERFEDLEREGALGGPSAVPLPGQDAVKALMGLGYPAAVSENAVRGALSAAPSDGTAELVKRALKHLATTRE